MTKIHLIIERDVRNFFKYRWWMAGLISMNLADLFILAVIFSNLVVRLKYFEFVLPGIAILALFASAFTIGREVYGEVRRGIHHYLLSLPVDKWEIILGRPIAGGIRGLIYATPMLLLAIYLSPTPNPSLLIIIPPTLFVLAVGISSLAIFLAAVVRNLDAYISIRGLLYFILMFSSTVFYPIDVFKELPTPIYLLALYNPVSHGADMMREILQKGVLDPGKTISLLIFSLTFLAISSILYYRRIQE